MPGLASQTILLYLAGKVRWIACCQGMWLICLWCANILMLLVVDGRNAIAGDDTRLASLIQNYFNQISFNLYI